MRSIVVFFVTLIMGVGLSSCADVSNKLTSELCEVGTFTPSREGEKFHALICQDRKRNFGFSGEPALLVLDCDGVSASMQLHLTKFMRIRGLPKVSSEMIAYNFDEKTRVEHRWRSSDYGKTYMRRDDHAHFGAEFLAFMDNLSESGTVSFEIKRLSGKENDWLDFYLPSNMGSLVKDFRHRCEGN